MKTNALTNVFGGRNHNKKLLTQPDRVSSTAVFGIKNHSIKKGKSSLTVS